MTVAGAALGIASEEGVSFSAYKIGEPSPFLPCGTAAKPCRGWGLFGFSNLARSGRWDIVIVLEGEEASLERAAERIKHLLDNPPAAEETARLSHIWIRKRREEEEEREDQEDQERAVVVGARVEARWVLAAEEGLACDGYFGIWDATAHLRDRLYVSVYAADKIFLPKYRFEHAPVAEIQDYYLERVRYGINESIGAHGEEIRFVCEGPDRASAEEGAAEQGRAPVEQHHAGEARRGK